MSAGTPAATCSLVFLVCPCLTALIYYGQAGPVFSCRAGQTAPKSRIGENCPLMARPHGAAMGGPGVHLPCCIEASRASKCLMLGHRGACRSPARKARCRASGSHQDPASGCQGDASSSSALYAACHRTSPRGTTQQEDTASALHTNICVLSRYLWVPDPGCMRC